MFVKTLVGRIAQIAALLSMLAVAQVAQAGGVAAMTMVNAFGAPTIAVNGSTTLTVTIGNTNAAAISVPSVDVLDTIVSAGLALSTPSGFTTDCAGGAPTAVAGSSSFSRPGLTIPNGGCFMSVNVTATTTGVKTANADFTGFYATGVPKVATLTVLAAVPVGVTTGVPTLGEWALLATVSVLLLFGVRNLRRRPNVW